MVQIDRMALIRSGDVSDLSDTDSVVGPSTSDGTFDNSTLVLSSPEQTQQGDESNHSVRTVAIAASLAAKLKAHQVSGVEFMWKQCFADLAYPDPPADVVERVGGCILAHVRNSVDSSFQYVAIVPNTCIFVIQPYLSPLAEYGSWKESHLHFSATRVVESP